MLLSCPASGYPIDAITWYRGKLSICTSFGKCLLQKCWSKDRFLQIFLVFKIGQHARKVSFQVVMNIIPLSRIPLQRNNTVFKVFCLINF